MEFGCFFDEIGNGRVDKRLQVWLNSRLALWWHDAMGRSVGYPSGQRGQTVNLLAYAFIGSNPIPTTTFHFANDINSFIVFLEIQSTES